MASGRGKVSGEKHAAYKPNSIIPDDLILS